jgi:hypothetical protein
VRFSFIDTFDKMKSTLLLFAILCIHFISKTTSERCLIPCEEPKCCDSMKCNNTVSHQASCKYDGNVFYCSCDRRTESVSRDTETIILLSSFFGFFVCAGCVMFILRCKEHRQIFSHRDDQNEHEKLLN